jgi:hypothetical protein
MKWRGWLGSFPVVVGLGVCGCETDGAYLTAASEPGLARAIAETGGGRRSRARADDTPPLPAAAEVQPVVASASALVRPAARIRARVNHEVILDEEVRNVVSQELRTVEALPEPERSQRKVALFKQAVDSIIDREVVLQEAFARFKANGPAGAKVIARLEEAARKEFDKQVLRKVKEQYKIGSDDELHGFFQSQGMELTLLRRHFERSFMAQEFLRHMVFSKVERGSGHAQILKYYETHPEEFQVPDSVNWQDLFISVTKHGKSWTREDAYRFADVLAQRIRKGEDFAKLGEVHDDGESLLRNADGQGHQRGEIASRYGEAVEKALFALSEGEVTVIEVDGGFRVVRVVKRQVAGQLPFDEKVQKQIKQKLQGEIFQREVKYYVNELRRKAVINYSNEAF